MTDLNLRAARIQLYGLIAALVFAIAVAIGLTAGAFTLSFSVLRDLATQGLMPAQWAWIFPAVVDGAILGATIAVVVLSKINGSDEGKKFFVRLLVAVVSISVVGNAFHAYQATQEAARKIAQGIDIGFTPLAPAASATIAVIAPLLVLAFSHGIGILIKAIGNAYREHTALVQQAREITLTVAADADADTDAVADVAPAVAPVAAMPETVAAMPETVAAMPATADDVVADVESVAAMPVAAADDATADIALLEVIPPSIAPAPQVTADHSDAATMAVEDAPERTLEELIAFIAGCPDLSENVRQTALLKIGDKDMSFSAIAAKTDTPHASTAQRRYRKAEAAARAAGFTVPPLPDLTDSANDIDEDVAETRELVTH